MKAILDELRALVLFLVAGVFAAAGIRLGEWCIPKPETRVIVCLASNSDNPFFCRTMEQLRKAK